VLDRVDKPVEQQLDLASMGRSDDERESHRCMVVGCFSRPV
jgi:hypothetical protein